MLNWFLAFAPVAVLLEHFYPTAHAWIFIASGLAILPLAGWMGRATEALATYPGEGVGGLLKATFGNAAELITHKRLFTEEGHGGEVAARPMDLMFRPGLVFSMFFAVWIAAEVAGDGESDWLKGARLLAIYVIPGILFFYAPIPASLSGTGCPGKSVKPAVSGCGR